MVPHTTAEKPRREVKAHWQECGPSTVGNSPTATVKCGNSQGSGWKLRRQKPGSVWSQVNLKRFAELKAQGRVAPAGQAAFDEGRARPAQYAYAREASELSAEETRRFEANPPAWAWVGRIWLAAHPSRLLIRYLVTPGGSQPSVAAVS